MKKFVVLSTALFMVAGLVPGKAKSQNYKLKQTTTMMGMKSESTIYVKGMRKRTEGGGLMGMGANLVTIEQCDLQRTIKLNDKKKLYFIEPFAQGNEEVIDEDAVTAKKAVVQPKKIYSDSALKKGGVITMWYSITDTGERKKMYGFTARHVWTSQKMIPSPDACYMKDSMEIKTDGWYIDLPQFVCPVHYKPMRPPRQPGEKIESECKDRFVTHRRGKGKLGFPLIETTTIKMGMGNPQSSNVETSIETMELSTTKLDSMLFEIPPGYQEAASEEDLQDNLSAKEMMKNMIKEANQGNLPKLISEEKRAGIIRIGVFAPTGDDEVKPGLLQLRMTGTLTSGKVEAVNVATEEEARKYNCDYILLSQFDKIKPAGKVGGILKAIKNANPMGNPSFNIQAGLTLKALSDGSVRSQPSVDGKYDGKIDEAAGQALDDGCRQVLKALK